jgi:D-sedoheptulose 7-phosphate isomerase
MKVMESWSEYVDTIARGLSGAVVTDLSGTQMSVADGIARWVGLTHDLKQRDGQLFFVGNGGSAGMASHMAADACKNGGLRALALNDAALITATSNDMAFDQIFALPIERLARPGDLLVAISSSGNSPNVVHALTTARAQGLGTITLSGKAAGNRARALGDLNFYVALPRYGWAESAHQVLLHYWFDQYLDRYGKGAI